MATTFVLLPSPLLGPAVWSAVAGCLSDAGRRVVQMSPATQAPATPSDVVGRFLNAVPADRPVILVPHSNAGLFVPHMVGQRSILATVFVDSGIPPEEGSVPLAPPALLDHLRPLAHDAGLLPVWTEWFDEADVAALFPDDATRSSVESEQRHLPLAYFESRLDVPNGWSTTPAAYLGFGDAYRDEQHRAAAAGWPVEVLAGGHLHMLVDPDGVTARLLDLADLVQGAAT